ncbi:MAG: threonine synthase [Bacillota bacterium]
MKYISTRDNYEPVSAAEAIKLGMVPTGGLFVPEEIPQFSTTEIYQMVDSSYQEIAQKVLSKYLTDYSTAEIKEAISKAYSDNNFDEAEITPLYKLSDQSHILELWHGPTAAFKDLALQIMPYLLSQAVEKLALKQDILILVATSGDTGKAALEGFKDVERIKIVVFYPDEGVSKIQERQMRTTGGENTEVVAVEGNFDDCQNSVKDIFGDQEFKQVVSEAGYQFSSANSINWGRLVPQIVYYFVAYSQLLDQGEIKRGDKINITVPTGNFGNILAAYYAYRMGLPVNKFICASNDNKVLTDFLQTGTYDKKREFKKTISPSMDILISSNLERFLFEVTNHNANKVNSWYQQLAESGSFSVDQETHKRISELFVGRFATEEETKETIGEVYEANDYLIDTHTAVAVNSYQQYVADSADKTVTVIDSTANPYKFAATVLEAIDSLEEVNKLDEFEILDKLAAKSDTEIHTGLNNLDQEQIQHDYHCQVDEIRVLLKELITD